MSTLRLPLTTPSLAALSVGLTVESVTLALSSLQLYLYFQAFFKDHAWSRFFVAFLWVLCCTHITLCMQALHHCLIAKQRDMVTLSILVKTIAVQAIVIGLLATTVQIFFAPKAKKLSSNWGLATSVSLLSLAAFVISLYNSF